ncbi:major facilitator superfamily [Jimgerdemannia flammicorona]|uniref:Major facilitator superfamily n=1 Tax=Jimgerdemannia flammicorona TaxID=994334 RepID=A0A433A113_9FUNG|nr:major facilitator superfamily [Jimgerdemannia flammicorona]
MAGLDGTIIASAIPKISSEYNSLNDAPWIATSYLISSNACQATFGKLSDIFGRRPTVIFAIVAFLVGCAVCASASNFATVVAGRVISGIGGGGILAMTLVLISDVVPMKQRAKFQGISAAVFGLSSAIGPVLGGVLTDSLGWRWIFWINLPFGAVSLVTVAMLLRLPKVHGSLQQKLYRIDYAGITLMGACTTFLLLAINYGGNEYTWDSPFVISCFWASLVCFIGFLYVEHHEAIEPVIPLRLFRNRWVVAVCLGNFMVAWVMFSQMLYLPLLFQVVYGDSPTVSGEKLVPMMGMSKLLPLLYSPLLRRRRSRRPFLSHIGGLVVFAIIGGILLTRYGHPSRFMTVGALILTIGTVLTSLFDQNTGLAREYGSMIVVGAGLGLNIAPSTIAVQAKVAQQDVAVATAVSSFFRLFGAAFGIAVFGTIHQNVLGNKLSTILPPGLSSLSPLPQFPAFRSQGGHRQHLAPSAAAPHRGY